ncbi:uncharacterized protein TrAtP1_004928 [Trichoderma atroviride]|uniref:uncharacterized protein n=1 Tax=Hypocrea atroviridis TaxID=63577 RepID=UPI003320BDDD|nr:hypothetical protein TrAtP1_004928 [Trichoderma atroviride]
MYLPSLLSGRVRAVCLTAARHALALFGWGSVLRTAPGRCSAAESTVTGAGSSLKAQCEKRQRPYFGPSSRFNHAILSRSNSSFSPFLSLPLAASKALMIEPNESSSL